MKKRKVFKRCQGYSENITYNDWSFRRKVKKKTNGSGTIFEENAQEFFKINETV